MEYNQRRPHSALAYRPPAPEAKLPRSQALGGPQPHLSIPLGISQSFYSRHPQTPS